jgi:hypothetical protein
MILKMNNVPINLMENGDHEIENKQSFSINHHKNKKSFTKDKSSSINISKENIQCYFISLIDTFALFVLCNLLK